MVTVSVEKQVFDQDGDLVLVLSRPYAEPKDKENLDGTTLDGMDGVIQQEETNVTGEEVTTDEVDESSEVQPDAKKSEQTDVTVEESKWVEVRCLVSSKHMMLASPVFKAMLQHGNFKEGKALQEGNSEIPLPDDDVAAFEIILNIVHNRSRKVPRQISLEDMTEISILVDKYQMVETVEVFSDFWAEDLKIELPLKLSDGGVYEWIGISWVFGKRIEFQKMTGLVLMQSHGDTFMSSAAGLPIPDLICNTIEGDRKDALFELYALIEQTINRYQRTEVLCPRADDNKSACDAMVLGTLTKTSMLAGIYPAPASPYKDISFETLVELVKTLKVEALCDRLSRVTMPNGKLAEPMHGFKARIDGKVKELDECLVGLDMDKFKELKERI